MHSIIYNILPIFFTTILGSIIRRQWLVSDDFWRGLEKLSFYILFPSMLFENTSKVDFTNSEFTRLTLALVTVNLIISAILIAYQLHNDYNRIQFTSVFQGATRFNNYIFFAVGASALGEEGLKIISTVSPYLIILTNIMAVMSFAHYIPIDNRRLIKRNSILLLVKLISTNPFVCASIAGVSLNYFQITLSPSIAQTIHNFSNSALTVGMLIVGAGLQFKIKQEQFTQVIFTSSIKLLLMPIITFIVLWIMNITGTSQYVGILFSCLPCASSSYILSRQLGGDPETMSSIITFTTIFSILSLSLFTYILG